jgi:hypothetical protein
MPLCTMKRDALLQRPLKYTLRNVLPLRRPDIHRAPIIVIFYEENLSSWCQGAGGGCEEGGCRSHSALLRPETRRASPLRRWARGEEILFHMEQ